MLQAPTSSSSPTYQGLPSSHHYAQTTQAAVLGPVPTVPTVPIPTLHAASKTADTTQMSFRPMTTTALMAGPVMDPEAMTAKQDLNDWGAFTGGGASGISGAADRGEGPFGFGPLLFRNKNSEDSSTVASISDVCDQTGAREQYRQIRRRVADPFEMLNDPISFNPLQAISWAKLDGESEPEPVGEGGDKSREIQYDHTETSLKYRNSTATGTRGAGHRTTTNDTHGQSHIIRGTVRAFQPPVLSSETMDSQGTHSQRHYPNTTSPRPRILASTTSFASYGGPSAVKPGPLPVSNMSNTSSAVKLKNQHHKPDYIFSEDRDINTGAKYEICTPITEQPEERTRHSPLKRSHPVPTANLVSKPPSYQGHSRQQRKPKYREKATPSTSHLRQADSQNSELSAGPSHSMPESISSGLFRQEQACPDMFGDLILFTVQHQASSSLSFTPTVQVYSSCEQDHDPDQQCSAPYQPPPQPHPYYTNPHTTLQAPTQMPSQQQVSLYHCPYPYCPAEFYTEANLTRHYLTDHHQNNLNCTWATCGIGGFTSENALVWHVKAEHLLECPVPGCCDRVFSSRKALEIHVRGSN